MSLAAATERTAPRRTGAEGPAVNDTAAVAPTRPGATPRSARRNPAGVVLGVLALALPVLVYLSRLARLGHWLVDDALISFGYARTLSEGGGFAQQPGAAAVEGFSNPTWTLLLAGLRLLGVFDRGHRLAGVEDTVLVVRALAVVAFVLTLLAIRATARSVLGGPRRTATATLVAGLALALSPAYVIWTGSGLENPLYGLLAAALAALLGTARARGRLFALRTATLAGLLALGLAATRPDGLVFAAAHPLTLLVVAVGAAPRGRGRLRSALRRALPPGAFGVAAFALPAGALLLARHATFGLWVPNTAVAKSQGGLDLGVPARAAGLVSAAGLPLVLLAALSTAVLLVARTRAARPVTQSAATATAAAPLLVCAALGGAGFAVLRPDWMPEYRFATPATVLGSALLGVLAVGAGVAVASPVSGRESPAPRGARWPGRRGPATAVVLAVVAALLAGAAVADDARRLDAFARTPTISGCFVADRYGRLFDLYADRLGVRTGTLVVPDIGGVLLVSRLRVVDLAGLTDRVIARDRGRGDTAAVAEQVFGVVRPTFLHLHRPWDAGLRSDPRLRRDYRAIVPGQDYVRRDVASAAAVAALRPTAVRRVAALVAERRARPLSGCGPWVVDPPPAER
ncbi:hypothetical protein FHX74_003974 [Friedmanniella endophytica]|uniref:4-amino-4-deoxy-L-arabinose transferase n=1 Tax=Microlunatus kandeliicorticis TaxID=1759536 RepID=A0A7W3IUC4_9ACTN|nr:hypothetical protein [Microlunatus kandeliicorticis]MBA8795335.1 hypothetical protein [Microlunatus kandeliicorticis]MBA8796321.1 hypothetical protein [Microlunatus kandeliicorticis]